MAHTGFGLASTTFLLRNFIKSLPNEMMEAARVDGATHYDIYIRIIIYKYQVKIPQGSYQ